jgi:hypothetical protein
MTVWGVQNSPNFYMVRGGCILTCQVFMCHASLNDGVVHVLMACGQSLVGNGRTHEYKLSDCTIRVH